MNGVKVFGWVCGFAALAVARYVFGAPLLLATFIGVAAIYLLPLGIGWLVMKVTRPIIERAPEGRTLMAKHDAEQKAAWSAREDHKKRQDAGERVDSAEVTTAIPGAWRDLLDQKAGVSVPPVILEAVRDALVPMQVDPERFFDNIVFLEVRGRESRLPSGQPKPRPTTSVVAKPYREDWPMGHPTWFIAAFPDVSKWVSDSVVKANFDQDVSALVHLANRDAKIERAIKEAGIAEGDEDAVKKLLYDSDGKTSPIFGRLLAEWYVEATGRRLETAKP
jgi:hypothetical protein